MPMRKPAVNLPEPLPTFAVPERPPSSERNRVAIRIDGITYLIWADQVEAFKARLAEQSKQDARSEIY